MFLQRPAYIKLSVNHVQLHWPCTQSYACEQVRIKHDDQLLCTERINPDGSESDICRWDVNSTNAFQDSALLWMWQVRDVLSYTRCHCLFLRFCWDVIVVFLCFTENFGIIFYQHIPAVVTTCWIMSRRMSLHPLLTKCLMRRQVWCSFYCSCLAYCFETCNFLVHFFQIIVFQKHLFKTVFLLMPTFL